MRAGHRSAIACSAIATAAFAVMLVSSAVAQDYLDTAGRWKTAHSRVLSGLTSDRDSAGLIWFYDSQIGFMTRERDLWDGAMPTEYRTTDGGRSWQRVYGVYYPLSRHDVDSGFAFGGNGWSTDRGLTWQSFDRGDTLTVWLDGYDRRLLVALTLQYGQPQRLQFSRDSGRTWTPLDSLAGSWNLSVRWGPLPAGVDWDRQFPIWWSVIGFADSTHLLVTLATAHIYHPLFIGLFDLDARTIVWNPIPRAIGRLRWIRPRTLWAIRYQEGGIASHVPEYLVVSTDAGRSWDSTPVPPTLDTISFRLVSRTSGLSTSHRTTDGGRTWQPVTHSYHGGFRSGFVLDSLTMVLRANYSLIAWSTDAGETWRQNAAGPPPQCVAARDGRVIVGRSMRSILVSADSGETCTELGSRGVVPPDLFTVWSLAWPDSVAEPHRVIGIASFRRRNAAYEVGVIESSDDGATWREGVRLPTLDSLLGTLESDPPWSVRARDYALHYARNYHAIRADFVRNADGSGTTGYIAAQRTLLRSTDGGRTWPEICDSIVFARLTMVDNRRGVAASVMTVSKPGALYYTTDGGTSWTWALTLYSPAHYVTEVGSLGGRRWQVLAPDQNLILHDDRYFSFRSDDDGVTWYSNTILRGATAAVGHLLWLDTADLHAFQEGAGVNHSTDGGETFRLLHPPDTRTFDIIRYGFDGSYMFVAAPGNTVGRWRIARRWRPLAGAPTGPVAASVSLDGETLIVRAGGEHGLAVDVVDLLGRNLARARLAPGDDMVRLQLTGAGSGPLFISLVCDGRRTVTCIGGGLRR